MMDHPTNHNAGFIGNGSKAPSTIAVCAAKKPPAMIRLPPASHSPHVRRSALSRTVIPNHTGRSVAKVERASTPQSRRVSSMLLLPASSLAALVDDPCFAVGAPFDHAAFTNDERCPCSRDFLVCRVVVQSPRGVDLTVRAANGSLVAKAETRRDVFVAHPARQHPRDHLFVRFEHRHRRALVLASHFLHA